MPDTSRPSVVIGLGNPGPRHAGDRHNAGFWLLDALALASGSRFRESARLSGSSCRAELAGQSVRLVKPGTFMNRSGQAMRRVMDYYEVPLQQILVVHDELDLPPGTARLKSGGGHGGHNGLRDITAHCGTDFFRLRIGIGHPGHKDAVTDYVLHPPSKADRECIDEALAEAIRALDLWYGQGYQRAVHYLHTATPREVAEPDLGPAG
jgi:PTH1 family peptidyl-tRNA hydrolase